MRHRAEQLARQSPIEAVRSLLRGQVADASSLDEVRGGFRLMAKSTVRGLRRDLAAVEAVLSEPTRPGELVELVEWDANWVLDEPTDAAAAAFLSQLADLLREAIEEAA
ncbi:hypothetical protein [Micromonospora polyrhachis]|uniref:Uncharacterized protein n=1 Tax=Micromonospora polyrhachis TaxID=1282883 RepID=A0A7W7WTL3_9ACTN|nr:hypothetical protein [Micromonospora polyrhachis]MBB4962598.1 hypothetical protein [Micromonospora polyrhachis]